MGNPGHVEDISSLCMYLESTQLVYLFCRKNVLTEMFEYNTCHTQRKKSVDNTQVVENTHDFREAEIKPILKIIFIQVSDYLSFFLYNILLKNILEMSFVQFRFSLHSLCGTSLFKQKTGLYLSVKGKDRDVLIYR